MKKVEMLIIGAGQAGLGAAYYLQQTNIDFLIVDAASKAGESWRQRWDSLRLFTPSSFDALPGRRLPYPSNYLPTKDEIADYLQSYARQFDTTFRFACKVERLRKVEGGFMAETAKGAIHARQVIVATGPFHAPYIPDFATELGTKVWQIHSQSYRNPKDVPANNNSGCRRR